MQPDNEQNAFIRVNISRKIDKTIKSDLEKLEKIAYNASSIKPDRLMPIKSANKRPFVEPVPAKKIDLNKEFKEKVIGPLTPRTLATQNAKKQLAMIPTHKYPFSRKDEAVTVDELRSRVHHGTVGVLPVRKSQEIDDLNFLMKGKTVNVTARDTDRSHLANDFYMFYDENNQEENTTKNENDIDEINNDDEEEDEGIEKEGIDNYHANTPADSSDIFHLMQDRTPSFSNKFTNPYKKSGNTTTKAEVINDYYLQELIKFRTNTKKPAILPQSGTSGPAIMCERPKPQIKEKTLTEDFKLKKLKEMKYYENLDEEERHQLAMENEVRNLVDDAKKFAKLSPSKSKQIAKRLNKKANTDSIENIMQDKTSGFSVEEISNEKLLLKSVEGLISAIKSGQLVKEQEQSSKRMQEILGSVLDKASLSLLDPSFKKNDSIFEEEEETEYNSQQNPDRKSSASIQKASSSLLATETNNELKVPSKFSSKHSAKSLDVKDQDGSSKAETISQFDQDNLIDASENDLDQNQNEGYYLQTERDMEPRNQSSRNRSLATEYDNEIQNYLATLSENVTYEDVLNTTAKKVKLFERETHRTKELNNMDAYDLSKKKRINENFELPVKKSEDRFARNLHFFCMLEHERRNFLLLPDELVNITRKFHTRNKYQFMQSHKNNKSKNAGRLSIARTSIISADYSSKKTLNSGGSAISSTEISGKQDWMAQKERSHEAAAQRVFDNLNEVIQFERQKTQYYKNDDYDTKSNADSGIGDNGSLDSWRLQAETALKEDFCLEAKKVKLEKIENISEFSLTFLRPAPPKMSIRPSQIRQHLFYDYKSVPPPVDDENLLNKPSLTPRRIKLSPTKSKSIIRSTPKSEKFNLIDELDEFEENKSKIELNEENNLEEDTYDDSELEFQFIIERILNRNYSSETDLRKLKWEENEQEESSNRFKNLNEDPIFAKEPQLFRTLSDSILTRKKNSKKINEYANSKDDEEEFIKIGTDYNDAIDEVFYQKQKIRDDYWNKNNFESGSITVKSVLNESHNTKTPDIDDEIKLIENTSKNSVKNLDDSKTTKTTDNTAHKYFPKTIKKTLAEQALEAGRHYMIMPEKKNKRSVTKNTNFKGKRLNLNLLDKIEKDIFESNIKHLMRSESTDKIKFPIRFTTQENALLRESNKIRKARRPSESNLNEFDDLKIRHNFKKSKWFTNENDFYDNEREWVRDIWVEWFDEVIPQLDGSIGHKSKVEDKKIKKQEESIQNKGSPSNKASNVNFNSSTNINNKNSRNKINVSVMSKKSLIEQKAAAVSAIDDDDDDKPRIIKSPTPYATYGQVDLDLDKNLELNADMIKLVEKEIEKLTVRIETRTNGIDLCRRGTLYRKLGFIKLGLNDLNKAIELEPKMLDAYWQRILIYLVQDKKVEAMESLKFLTNLNNLSKHLRAGAFLAIGDLYAEQKDISLAIVNYSQTVKYNPSDYRAFFKRAQMYETRGDIRMAMDDYLTTTKLNPKIYEAWFKHGMYYFNNKNFHYAIVDFTEMIKNNPNNQAQARLYRGKCYLNLEDYQLALEDFSIALHLDPNDWESYYHRGCLLRKLHPRQALQDLSVSLLIESGDENINSYLHRGILYSDNERYDEAIKDFQSVLSISQEFAPAYVNLGIIYMNVSMNYWKAIKHFNLAIKSDPVYIRAYLCRAQAYRIIHDLKSAYIDYTKAIHMDPLNTQIYIYRGQVILEMGNLKLAAFCVQHASFLNEGANNRSKNKDDQSLVRMLSSRGDRQKDTTKSISRFSGFSQQTSQSNFSSSSNQSVTQRALVFSFLKNYQKAISVLDYDLRIKLSSDKFNLLGRVYMKAKNWEQAVNTFDKSIEFNTGGVKPGDKSVNSTSMLAASLSKLSDQDSRAKKKDLIDAYFMRGQCLLELYKSQEAYDSFHQVIELNPNNAEAYYYRGLSRVTTNHSKCIQDFNKALAINPELFEAFLARACIYGMQGRYTKAILNCNQAVKLNKKSVRGYLYRGALKYQANSPHYAIHDLTEAIKLDQTCALAFYNRALCFQQIKNYKNALKDFSVVLMLGEYLKFKVYINRGLLYFSLKDYSNSLTDFKLASEFLPEDFKIQHMIGVCLHKLKRYNEAIAKLTQTYELNQNFLDSLISRGNVYVDYGKEEGFIRAQNDYEHVLLKNPRNIDAHINLGYLYQITGRFKRAWQQFTTAIQIKPNAAEVYEGRSVVCLQMRDTSAALKDMNQAIRLKPTAELFVNRGVIHQFMADNVNAMRDYQTALMMNGSYGLAYYNSANIYLMHRQYDQALKNLDNAINLCDMKDESTFQNRAIAKAFNNDTSGAFRDLCEAIKYGSYSAHIFMNRGLLLFKMENFKLAEKDFTTAINLSPNDALLYKLRADCKGKLERKEEAIEDYKLSVDIKHRENLRKEYLPSK